MVPKIEHSLVVKRRRIKYSLFCTPTLTILTGQKANKLSFHLLKFISGHKLNESFDQYRSIGTQTISKVLHSVNMAQKQTNSRTPKNSPLL